MVAATPYQKIVDEKEKDVRIGNILAARAVRFFHQISFKKHKI